MKIASLILLALTLTACTTSEPTITGTYTGGWTFDDGDNVPAIVEINRFTDRLFSATFTPVGGVGLPIVADCNYNLIVLDCQVEVLDITARWIGGFTNGRWHGDYVVNDALAGTFSFNRQ